jgi:DNA-binding XRE family transcriptional regulator
MVTMDISKENIDFQRGFMAAIEKIRKDGHIMIQEKIVNNIRRIRKEKSLSQESVAYDLGLDYSTYGKIERGKIGLSVNRLEEIAKILNVKIQDLYEWKG